MKSVLSRYLPRFFKRNKKRVNFNEFSSKLDNLALEVWDKNHKDLIKFDNHEIPVSVWGFSLRGKMSDAQARIFSQLNPMIEQILDALRADAVSDDKVKFVNSLVRNLIALKFAYMRDLTLLRKQTMQTDAKINEIIYPMNLN